MSLLESILLIFGISLDIFAAMEIQGAMLAQVKKKSLAIACTITIALQLLFFLGGYFVCYLLRIYNLVQDPTNLGEIAAVVIFGLLGVRLIVKAIRREFVQEKRRDSMKASDYIKIIAVTTVYTLGAGCAAGMYGGNLLTMIVEIIICSILVVSGGLYTGYRFGFENKTFAYVAGAIMLWGAGVVIVITDVMKMV